MFSKGELGELVLTLTISIIAPILIGTIGILARAKKKGLAPALKPLLDKLMMTNFWIDDVLYRSVLLDAGEG